jgi:hypothetical protein
MNKYSNIKKLNRLIEEELRSVLLEAEDDIKVTTDEPEEGGEALDILRQIYDLVKPEVEMGDEMPEPEEEESEGGEEGGEDEKEDIKEEVYNQAVADDAVAITLFLSTVVGLGGGSLLLAYLQDEKDAIIDKFKKIISSKNPKADAKTAAKELKDEAEMNERMKAKLSNNSLNESVSFQGRMKKLANIRG